MYFSTLNCASGRLPQFAKQVSLGIVPKWWYVFRTHVGQSSYLKRVKNFFFRD